MRRRRFPMILALMVLSLCTASVMARDILVGRWEAVITPDDANSSAKELKDVLTFKAGQFTADKWNQLHGFKPTPYDENIRPTGIGEVSINQSSDTGGNAVWQATIASGEMTGTLLWTDKSGNAIHYSFHATKK